jgi:hypothetical protein
MPLWYWMVDVVAYRLLLKIFIMLRSNCGGSVAMECE